MVAPPVSVGAPGGPQKRFVFETFVLETLRCSITFEKRSKEEKSGPENPKKNLSRGELHTRHDQGPFGRYHRGESDLRFEE